jgi:hypothetical protein
VKNATLPGRFFHVLNVTRYLMTSSAFPCL